MITKALESREISLAASDNAEDNRWLEHFHNNRRNRREPVWDAPITLAASVVRPLLRSLEQFELGDGGGPDCLIAWNADRFRLDTKQRETLIDLWFQEEKEHSRLLGELVTRFNGRHIKGHWSFHAFCLTRRIFGVGFELTVLLLTEIASTAYYRLLHRHGDDPALRGVCHLILRDEAGHVAFHRDRLASDSRRPYGRLWESSFFALGYAAATMLWINHASAMQAVGGTRAEFYAEVRDYLAQFVDRLRAEHALYRQRIVAKGP